jgi:hypothetical protein
MSQIRTTYLHASMPILCTVESVHTMTVSSLISVQTNTLIHKRISNLRMCITDQAVPSRSLAEFYYRVFCNLLYWATTLVLLCMNGWSDSLLGYSSVLLNS